jgi:hypothetical protein
MQSKILSKIYFGYNILALLLNSRFQLLTMKDQAPVGTILAVALIGMNQRHKPSVCISSVTEIKDFEPRATYDQQPAAINRSKVIRLISI